MFDIVSISKVEVSYLSDEQVHVWLLPLATPLIPDETSWQWLDNIEKARLEKLRFTPSKQQFLRTHGQLRWLLSQYSKILPGELVFDVTPQGKPVVEKISLNFNLAHSSDWAIVGVTPRENVGVDIEDTKRLIHYQGIAQRFFSPLELRQMEEAEDSRSCFFKLWVLKEAYVKALGVGIHYGFEHFVIDISNPDIISLYDEKGNTGQWKFELSQPQENYVAGIAVSDNIKKIQYFQLET